MDVGLALLLVGAVLLLLLKGLDRASRQARPLPQVPQVNAYTQLLARAEQIRKPPGELADLGMGQIRQLAAENQPALDGIHQVLQADSAVPLEVSGGWVEKHAQEVKNLKRLGVALAIQSHVNLLEHQTNEAVMCHLYTILLAHAMARGGVVSDGINSLVVETIGTASLRACVPMMDAGLCRTVAQQLENAEARRQSPEDILKTESCWSARSFGLISRIGGLLLRRDNARRQAEFRARYNETTRRTRRLMLMCAARAFELQTNVRANQPAALTPAILRGVPIDPVTSAPFKEIPRPAENGPL